MVFRSTSRLVGIWLCLIILLPGFAAWVMLLVVLALPKAFVFGGEGGLEQIRDFDHIVLSTTMIIYDHI